MGYPEDLLEQARHLAKRESKRPRQASLRRSVSTAYYALFHLLTTETAKNWKHQADRPLIARMLDHGRMKSACEKKGSELRSNSNAQGVVVRNLLTVTETFIQMQQHRHMADYDYSTKWTRVDVLQKVDSVEAAFRSWRAVRGRAEAQRFLAVLLAKSRP